MRKMTHDVTMICDIVTWHDINLKRDKLLI